MTKFTPQQITQIIKYIRNNGPIPKLEEAVIKYVKAHAPIPDLEDLVLRPHGPVSTKHVDLNPHKDFDTKLFGTLWTRKTINDKKALIEVPKQDFNKFNVLAFGGIDFDSKFHLGALLKSLETLSPNLEYIKAAAIYPNALRKERFEAAIEYNRDKLYYSKYIEDLTRDIVLPRFLNDSGTLSEPKVPLSFYSFSVGAREIMMVENCLRHIFKTEHQCSNIDICDLFTFLHANCIAYALDFDNLPELRFSKNIIFSVEGIGVLRPVSLIDNVLDRALSKDITNFYTPIPGTELSGQTNLIILGSGTLPDFTKDQKLSPLNSHSLPHYIEGIMSDSGIYDVILASFKAFYETDYD